MIHSLYLNWISLERYSSFWNHLIVRNLILVFGLGSTFSSCEEDMIYEFATTSISSSDYEVCSYDQCPEVSLAYVEFNTPELLGKEVNKDIESLLMEQLIVEGQTASSIKEALELYLSNAQNSYPEGSVFSPLLLKMLTLRSGIDHPVITPFSDAEIKLHFDHIANKLADNDYILGPNLTAADFGIAYVCSMAERLGQLGNYPTLQAYMKRITSRNAFVRAVEKAVE